MVLSETEPRLLPGEQVIWRHDRKKGIFRRRIVETTMITNRAIRLNQQALDLANIDEIVVSDRFSRSRGSFSGYSYGPRGAGIRMRQGRGQSQSRQYGDLVFFSQGRRVFTVDNIADPTGTEKLIRASNPHIK